MPEIFPSTLQQNLDSDYSETQKPRYLETDVAIGPVKKRSIYTKAMPILSGQMLLTEAQYLTFRNFYDITLGGGVKTFFYNHPITGQQKTYRFSGDPDFSAIGPIHYKVSFKWEEL